MRRGSSAPGSGAPAVSPAGRHVLVAGASRGIGAAVAEAFAAGHTRLVLAARTKDALERVADRCRRLGASCTPLCADVSDPAAVERLVRQAAEPLQDRFDALVNCAAIVGPVGPLHEVGHGGWRRTIDVNLLSVVTLCAAVLPYMLRRRSGSIVTFSGGGATAPLPGLSAYAATKAAVVSFTETLAEEVRAHGIRVNAIAPGLVDTRLLDPVLAAGALGGPLQERVRRMRERGEGTPPEAAAALAVYLASGRGRGLTGKLISAVHDDWRRWSPETIALLDRSGWYTLRRLDPHTLEALPSLAPPPSGTL